MLITSFQNSEGFTLKQYESIFTNDYILQGFKNSITLSVISAMIALLITLFAVYAMMKFSEPVRRRF